MIISRVFLKVIGLFFVGLAILGVVLPILPTTPFLLVAAGCFAKSSPSLHQKLLDNKTFGPLINDWQRYRTIPKKAKRIALLTMILSLVVSALIVKTLWITAIVFLLMLGPFVFICNVPNSKQLNTKH